MSRWLDLNKFKDVFLNSLRVGEMWFRGVMLYVKKRAPEVTLTATASDGKIHLTAQFVDYEHRYRYADERNASSSLAYTHGIVFKKTSNGTGNPPSASGWSRIKFTKYSADGTFTYPLGSDLYGSKSQKLYAKAWIAYIDPETGEAKYAYSRILSGFSYNGLL